MTLFLQTDSCTLLSDVVLKDVCGNVHLYLDVLRAIFFLASRYDSKNRRRGNTGSRKWLSEKRGPDCRAPPRRWGRRS